MVVVFGTVCLDRMRRIARMPRQGGYEDILEAVNLVGGEAANTTIALRNWGTEAILAANSLGEGPDAQWIRDDLSERGVQMLESPDNNPTPYCEVFVTSTGQRTMFGSGFVELSNKIAPGLFPLIPGAWFTVDLNPGQSSTLALERAAQSGMKLYLLDHMDGIAKLTGQGQMPIWQSSTDWVGAKGNTQKNVAWLSDFVGKHRVFGILSDGPNGFVAGSAESEVRVYPPYPCPDLLDSTGAGDIFRAGMLHGLDQDWHFSRCLQFASAAGCLNSVHLGASAAVPAVQEILGLISQNPVVSRQYER